MTLSIKDVKKSFGENEVLKGINIEAFQGSAVGLLGRNGAGKTTALRIVMGVFPPDSGEILLNGERINRDKIGYLPEERGLYPKRVILEQLIYFGCLRGMKKEEARASAMELLMRLDADKYYGKKLETLSKGNQQKIQLAAALVTKPDIVILDEPFSGLDPVNAILLRDIVKELIEAGKIVLFSSHQMNYIEEFCQNIAILNKGEIVLSGKLGDIKRSYVRDTLIINCLEKELLSKYIKDNLGRAFKTAEILEDTITVKLISPSAKNEFIKAVINSGIDIDGVRVYEPELRDIFISYAGEEN